MEGRASRPRRHPAPARLVAIEDWKLPNIQGLSWHPVPDGQRPVTGATVDRYSLAAARRQCRRRGRTPGPVDLPDASVRQTERDQWAISLLAEIPADRAGTLGQQLDRPQIRERVGLQAAQLPRSHEPVEAGRVTLFDQRLRQALLALRALVVIRADDRPQRGRGLDRGLSLDVGR